MMGSSGALYCAMHMVDGLMLSGRGESRHALILDIWDKGCVELYVALGSYAELCDQLFIQGYEKHNHEAPGVFDYEVSCEFGGWFGDHIVDTGAAPTHVECVDKLEELNAQFWKQMDDYKK